MKLARDEKLNADRSYLATLFAQVQTRGFYGKITLIMEAGEIRRVVKEESLMPLAPGHGDNTVARMG